MKIYRLLSICLFAGLFSSCNDWLDVEPSTQTDRSSLFKNEAGYADAMSGIYVNMTDNRLYGKTMTWHVLELMGGGAKTLTTGTSYNYQQFCFHPKSKYYNEAERRSVIDNIWNTMYNTIANLNSMLETVDNQRGVFAGNDYAVFKGEALGLRAFLHFDLLRLFSDAVSSDDYNASKKYIPYVSTLGSDVSPLLTVGQCGQLILKDLQTARDLLKEDPMYTGTTPSQYVCDAVPGNATSRIRYGVKDWHNRRFHFNYWAAVATMARVYLWMGDQQKALECAKEVINAPQGTFVWVAPELVSNITNTSNNVARDRTFSTEQIFSLNILDLPDRMDGYMWQGNLSFDTHNSLVVAMNTDCFEATTQSNDPRYAFLRKDYSVNGKPVEISAKYYTDDDPYNNSPWAARRLPLIRMSEMYYIAAECEPDLNVAMDYLEQVRRHRGLSAYPLNCTNKDQLQDEIEKEYRKEFIAEGQTFYYYKRRNMPVTNYGASAQIKINPNLYTMPRPEDEDLYGGRN